MTSMLKSKIEPEQLTNRFEITGEDGFKLRDKIGTYLVEYVGININ